VFVIEHEAFGEMDPFTWEGKPEQVIKGQDFTSAKESLLFCDFWRTSRKTYSELLKLVTDYPLSYEDLVLAGERIWNLGRLFNIREGYRRDGDYLPLRMYQPIGKPPDTDKMITKEGFQAALSEYYAFRGWDEQGIPTLDKLHELGLDEFADIVKEAR
jgi:aldehyde:ferredoxin oxidoreductase